MICIISECIFYVSKNTYKKAFEQIQHLLIIKTLIIKVCIERTDINIINAINGGDQNGSVEGHGAATSHKYIMMLLHV